MAVTINADTTNGLVMTPDTSGEIKLQSAGTDTVTVNSSGKILAATGGGWSGTVSDTGTSSIIERGSNANGNYTKFADGTMFVTGSVSVPGGASTASVTATYTYPATFTSDVFGTVSSNTASNVVTRPAMFSTGVGLSSSGVNVIRSNSTSTTCYVFLMGRWY